jgi:hypothetical protein
MLLALLVFAALLAVEWKRRSKVARTGAVALALVALSFAQPIAHRAARTVISAPRAERILEVRYWPPLSDYQSGVLTMERAMVRDIALGADARSLSIGVLVWPALIASFRPADKRG